MFNQKNYFPTSKIQAYSGENLEKSEFYYPTLVVHGWAVCKPILVFSLAKVEQ